MTKLHRPGFPTVTTTLVFQETGKALAFYEKAFGAKVRANVKTPDGMCVHAEFSIGETLFFASDLFPQSPVKLPTASGPTNGFYLYADDCDAAVKKALAAGAKQVYPCMDMFYGDRMGVILDPFGYCWTLATHKEDVPEAEMGKRMKVWAEKLAAGGAKS